MIYGLNLSASGALAAMYRLDVHANNLANSETVGFKPVIPATRQREAAAIEDGLPHLPSDALLERLGGGVHLLANRVSRAQGTPERTGSPTDLALQGEGFLVVRQGTGDDAQSLRLTRDGRLALNSRGQLVQASTGLAVLDVNNRPISLSGTGEVRIDSDGTIRQGGATAGRLRVATVDEPGRLRALGEGLYAGTPADMARLRPGTATVLQGSVERSAVDPVRAMLDINAAERAVGSNTRMIQLYDELMERAVNRLGRVT